MSERGRSRPPAPPPEDDPSIPVLTERLTLPAIEVDFTLPPLPPATPGSDDLPRRPVAESPRTIDAVPPLPPLPPMQPSAPLPATAPQPATLPGTPMIPASIARAPQAPAVEPPRILGSHAEPFDLEPPEPEPEPVSVPVPVQTPVRVELPDPRAELLRAVMQRMQSDVEQLVSERFGAALESGVQTALQQAAAQLAAQLSTQLARQLAPQLSAQLAAPLAAQVTAQVAAQISSEARTALAGSVHALIDQALSAELDQLRAGDSAERL